MNSTICQNSNRYHREKKIFKGLYKMFLSLYFLSGMYFKDKKSCKEIIQNSSTNNDTDMIIGNHRGRL